MAKSKDVILVDLYNEQEVRMVLNYLRKKQLRVRDRERKIADNKNHQRKIAEKYGKVVA